MVSDVTPGQIPVTGLVHGGQTPKISNPPSGGKILPASGKVATVTEGATANAGANTAAAAASAATAATHAASAATAEAAAKQAAQSRATDPTTLAKSLNKFLNDSGRPDQFRVDPASNNTLIQQINPANGAVLEEFSVNEFPALARSIGASGLLVDDVA